MSDNRIKPADDLTELRVPLLHERLTNHISKTEAALNDHEERLRNAEFDIADLKSVRRTVGDLVRAVDDLRKQYWIANGIFMTVLFLLTLIPKLA
jgi:hypothetical protein